MCSTLEHWYKRMVAPNVLDVSETFTLPTVEPMALSLISHVDHKSALLHYIRLVDCSIGNLSIKIL